MKKIILPTLILLCLNACKKNETNDKYDWDIATIDGYIYKTEYDKSETEIAQLYPELCKYFRKDEPKFCWYFNDGTWKKSFSEKYIKCFLQQYQPQKVDCKTSPTSEFWYTRTKHIHKKTEQFWLSNIIAKWYHNDDTLEIFNNKSFEMVISNTSDSLIILQRSNNGFDFY
ncbi:MAG TPA: hypothetical protein PLQ78_04955 [Flavipsychrobacter sp.]|jgi:hypothetical protein|nr:hypothetical protein [Flavipsychrobacter sp.]